MKLRPDQIMLSLLMVISNWLLHAETRVLIV